MTLKYIFLVLLIIFHFDLEKFVSKNCKYAFFNQKFVYLGENTSKYCSRIIVVHDLATVFFRKFTQHVTILQTVSNQEVTLKRLISILRTAQKLYVGAGTIYVRFINCSYNNVTKDIRLLDKKPFCLYRKISCKQELLKDLSP